MELLFSRRFALKRSSLDEAGAQLEVINSMINKGQMFLWTKCTGGAFANGDNTIMALYESFYRKLVLRDRSLPRPWVFTTNYDLFNETAMDRLGLPYANGFSGVVERRFNPATFRYQGLRVFGEEATARMQWMRDLAISLFSEGSGCLPPDYRPVGRIESAASTACRTPRKRRGHRRSIRLS